MIQTECLRFDGELFEIGHLTDPEQKSQMLRGRYDLAVKALVTWDNLQIELRKEPGLASVRELMRGELREVEEKEPLERELISLRDKGQPWYKRPRARDYWAVANEMADVLVFVVGDMRLNGLRDDQVFEALVGRAHHEDKQLINEMIARTAALGMDLAEVMILKTEINLQHRDPGLLAWVRGDGFMKRIRKSIGGPDSQIPHLAQGPLGVTVLSCLQSPRLFGGLDSAKSPRVDILNLEPLFQNGLAIVLAAQAARDPEGFFAVV